MAQFNDDMERTLLFTRMLAVNYLIAFPVMALFMMFYFNWRQSSGFQINLPIFIIVLAYAALGPLVIPVIERGLIKKYHQKPPEKKLPHKLIFNIVNSKMAFACAVFCYGLGVFLFSRNIVWTLCFYPVGIFWGLRFWPRRKDFEQYLQRIEANVAA